MAAQTNDGEIATLGDHGCKRKTPSVANI